MISMSSSAIYYDTVTSTLKDNSCSITEENSKRINDNPLLSLPIEVRENIITDYYETGKSSIMQRYVESVLLNNPDAIQRLFNDIFLYSVINDSHILAWNILVVLSQISYEYLGSWADMLAVSATRNKYLDVQEMGIRCFENWENHSSYAFLKRLKFTESWLQEYADEVCAEEVEHRENVLSEKNYSWKVARGKINTASNFERYSGGYSSCRIQDRSEQIISLANSI